MYDHRDAYDAIRKALGVPDDVPPLTIVCEGSQERRHQKHVVARYRTFTYPAGVWFPVSEWAEDGRRVHTRATRKNLIDGKVNHDVVPLPSYGARELSGVPSWLVMVPEELWDRFGSQYEFRCPHCRFKRIRNDDRGEASEPLFREMSRLAAVGRHEVSVRELVRNAWS